MYSIGGIDASDELKMAVLSLKNFEFWIEKAIK
jgi:hypothetical protein